MRISSRFIIFLLFFLSCNIFKSEAQTNYLPGYYVTHENDTIHGYIAHLSGNPSSNHALFKESPDSQRIKFLPGEIKGYGITGKLHYRSYSFTKRGHAQTAFLKVLVDGEVSLLEVPSRVLLLFPKPNFFVYDQGSEQLIDLDSKEEIITIDEKKYLAGEHRAKGILNYLLNDQKEVIEPILQNDKYLYNATDLTNLFVTYYQSKDTTYTVAKEIPIPFHAGLNVVANRLVQSMNTELYGLDFEFEPEQVTMVGLMGTLFIPRVNENMRIILSLQYGEFDKYSYYKEFHANNDLLLSFNSLETGLGLRWSNISPISLTFDASVNLTFHSAIEYTWRKEVIANDEIRSRYVDLLSNSAIGNNGLGYTFRVGKNINVYKGHRLNLSARYSSLTDTRNEASYSYYGLEISLQVLK